MTPERLHRIRAVYEAAVDSPAAARQALLDHECDGDADLRQEVEKLLGARENLPPWLAGPVLGMAHAAVLGSPSTVTQSAPSGHVPFASGTVLGQRYRIVHLLGRGGMGEVYRADDLLLGQPVALKFLPAAATANVSALNRFRNEVRTARQVSHPSVCRVYDIGEAEGLTYLSMEYVDGEDLASLLRRIGKLPEEKALEIARQLCAGVAAAHDKSVVHRDLKPANIMLDGKGQVRITDFGIAGVATQIRDTRSGTPAYMSPEQLAGKEVTARSDIYALGIVLCELLTGKRPPLVDSTGMDPKVERVIRRCLEPDPQMRPGSALSVSAALPGGDPLAAALARGDTPAPELVANAGPAEGLRPWVAVTFLAAVVVGLGLSCVLRQQHDLINKLPMENSPEVLAAKAREIAKSFGYTERPVDTIYAWEYDEDYLRFAREPKNPPSALSPYPPAIHFWYRQSSHYPNTSDLDVYESQREALGPGMQDFVLDSEGRLIAFEARPSTETHAAVGGIAFDWSRLFEAAGLDAARFQAAPSKLIPLSPFDARAAWTGSTEGATELRVEAAAFDGRPVSFRVLGPWARPSRPPAFSFRPFPTPIFILFMLALPGVAGFLAWRNVRSGRGDRQGAFRVASFLSLGILLEELLFMHHVPTLAEFGLLYTMMQSAVALGALGWLLYMAFEPQLRKRAPEILVSWNRVLAGRFRDPVVGGHLLAGIAVGTIGLCAAASLNVSPFVAVFPPQLPSSNASLLAWLSYLLIVMIPGGLGCALLISLISMAVQRRWLAAVLFVLLMTLIVLPSYSRPSLLITVRLLIIQTVFAFTLVRFGVLATVAALFAAFVIELFPLTTNWSAWYAPAALLGIATLIGLALYGFVTTLSGRKQWSTKADA
jgi:serine/threonine protein kinase